MKKENKGLTDNHDGEIILNESGTSVTTDQVEEGAALIKEDKIEKEEERGPALLPGNE